MDIHDLRSFVLWAVILGFLVACWRVPPERPSAFALMGLVALLALPLEIHGYLSTIRTQNNAVFYNAFELLEFFLVLGMLKDHWREPIGLRSIGVLGGVLYGANMLLVDPRITMLYEGIVVLGILLASVNAIVLWRLANESIVPLPQLPIFWLCIGSVLYFGGLAPVVAMAHFVQVKDVELATLLWTLVPTLGILRYALAIHACSVQRSMIRGHE